MKITVKKSEVYREVEKRSALAAASAKEADFEGVWATEHEGMLLDTYWVEGCSALVQTLARLVCCGTAEHNLDAWNAGEVLSLDLDVSGRFNGALAGSLTDSVKMALACNVLAGWMSAKKPESAETFRKEAEGYVNDIRVKIFYRIPPGQPGFGVREMDNINFRQYEKCQGDHPQGGGIAGCGEYSTCDGQEAARIRK